MKNLCYILSAYLLVTLTFSSCKEKDVTAPLVISAGNNNNAMAITGYGYSNAVFYFNYTNSSGYYDTLTHQTYIRTVEDTDSLHLEAHIRIYVESAFLEQDTIPNLYDASDTIQITNKTNLKTSLYGPVFPKSFLTITEYGSVGSYINGVFSGAFVNIANNLDSLKVANGRFSVLRSPDVY